MSFFLCPECQQYRLKIGPCMDMPPDARWDELTLQLVSCHHCHFEGLAIYCESRRGRLDDEVWDHTGFRSDEVANLRQRISECPEPRNEDCRCDAHSQLGRQDETQRWSFPRGLDWKVCFPMMRSSS